MPQKIKHRYSSSWKEQDKKEEENDIIVTVAKLDFTKRLMAYQIQTLQIRSNSNLPPQLGITTDSPTEKEQRSGSFSS